MINYLDSRSFLDVVRNTPLVSIDLVVMDNNGSVLLGQRKNAPAKNYWFVPGGRIYKNETLDMAFTRISQTELGRAYKRKSACFLGNYDHIYDDNFAEVSGIGTHYVVIAYKITVTRQELALPNEQHSSYQWLPASEIKIRNDVHVNTMAYFM